MNPPDPAEEAPQISAVQSWLLGHIDTPTLQDRIAGSAELATAYGRAIADPEYAATLIEEAQRAQQEQAYSMYEAATDQMDEAQLLAQEAEGQPVGDEWRDRDHDFRDACRSLGLPPSGGQVAEPEQEVER